MSAAADAAGRASNSATRWAARPAACIWRRWPRCGTRWLSAALACRLQGEALRIAPRLPPAWEQVALALRHRGSAVRRRLRHGQVQAAFDAPGRLLVGDGEPRVVGPDGVAVAV